MVTAVACNRPRVDGLDTIVQAPSRRAEKVAYLQHTAPASYEQMEAAQARLVELLHHLMHVQGYRKRTEIAVELVRQVESYETRSPRSG